LKRRRAAALTVTVLLTVLAGASCGASRSAAVRVGSQTISKTQLASVLAIGRSQYRSKGIPFPRPGTAEYRLLTQQALGYLVERAQAAQADPELGLRPAALLVTTWSFARVTARVRVADAEVNGYYAAHRSRSEPVTIDRGTAGQIRTELLSQRQKAAMKAWLARVRKRFAISYSPGYAPVSEVSLARRIWRIPAHGSCDLPVGSYSFANAAKHGCLGDNAVLPGALGPPCSLIDLPTGAPSGFTSAEENSGYAEYVTDVAGSCVPDPRDEKYQVSEEMVAAHQPPVPVSYLNASGAARYTDNQYGFTMTYPRRFHLQVASPTFERVREIEIANFSLRNIVSTRPLARGAVEFTLADGSVGRPLFPRVRDSAFPLALSEFQGSARASFLSIQGSASILSADVMTGPAVSSEDLAALKAIVASIRFPALRDHTFTPSGYLVLGRAVDFPLGFVKRYPGVDHGGRRMPFFLVHSQDGFFEVSAPEGYAPGYACDIRFDRAARKFQCPNGAVWNLSGDVLVNPDPSRYQNEPLQRAVAPVSFDGHVLVF